MTNRRHKPAALSIGATPKERAQQQQQQHQPSNGSATSNGRNGSTTNGKHGKSIKHNGVIRALSEDAGAGSSTLPRSRSSSFGFGYAASSVEDDDREDAAPLPIWSGIYCADGRGHLNWLGLGVVCSMMALLSLGIHLLLDVLGEQLLSVGMGSWYTSLGVVAVLLAIVSVPMTHGLGQRKNSLYKLFQPFVGGLRFVILQVIAWTLWTVTVLGGIYGVWVGGKKLTAGWLSAVGVGGVVSQLLVLVSLHFFVSNVSTNQRETVALHASARLEGHARKLARDAEEKVKQAVKQAKKVAGLDVERSPSPPVEQPSPLTPPTEETQAHLTDAASTSIWPYSSIAMKVTFLLIATTSLLLAVFVESAKGVTPSARASIQSFVTSAILLAVPITHLLARKSLTHAGYLLFQPFKGGRKFVALQAIAWTLWTLAFISAGVSLVLFIFQHDQQATGGANAHAIPSSWLSNLITSAGVGGILSQALVLLSLKYFDSRLSRTVSTTARVLERVREEVVSGNTPHPETPGSSKAAAGGRRPLADMSLAEIERDVLDRAVQMLSSPSARSWSTTPISLPSPRSATSASGATSPFGFGATPGGASSSSKAGSRPSTPLSSPRHVPGKDAASTLAFTESAVGGGVAEGLLHLIDDLAVIQQEEEPSTTLASVSLSDLRSSLSLALHYYSPSHWPALARESFLDARAFFVIACLYMVPIVGAVIVFAPFYAMYRFHPLAWYWYTAYGTVALMYLSTYRNRPSLTGARSWPAFRESRTLWSSMERYFNGRVITLGALSSADGPYIFGFHPHGIYPMTCFWATHGDEFRRSYPGLQVDVCAASIMFQAPILREVIMWAGGREVSGSALRYALQRKRSVMLIPGGQREMRHSKSNTRAVTLVTRHRGFIRMALEHGTPLVPVLSIGETMLLENIDAPRMQAYTLRTIGVGFPIWPYGRWYSPMPNAHPVLVVYGHPIPVDQHADPTNEQIEEIHAKYYAQLQDMFATYKVLVPGFEHTELIYTEE